MEIKAQPWACHELRLEAELCSICGDGLQLLRAGLVFKERHLKGLGSCTSHLAARGSFKEHCPEQVPSSALPVWEWEQQLWVLEPKPFPTTHLSLGRGGQALAGRDGKPVVGQP